MGCRESLDEVTKAHKDEIQDDLQVRIDIDNVTRDSGDDKRLISFRISRVPGSLLTKLI